MIINVKFDAITGERLLLSNNNEAGVNRCVVTFENVAGSSAEITFAGHSSSLLQVVGGAVSWEITNYIFGISGTVNLTLNHGPTYEMKIPISLDKSDNVMLLDKGNLAFECAVENGRIGQILNFVMPDKDSRDKWENLVGGGGLKLSSLLLNIAHPVGSIIQTSKPQAEFDPNTMLGGEWRLLRGVFLYGAEADSAITSNIQDGGEKAHRLSIDEMPAHNHSCDYATCWDGVQAYGWIVGTNAGNRLNTWQGGNIPHNNMPPYKAVNIWERVS